MHQIAYIFSWQVQEKIEVLKNHLKKKTKQFVIRKYKHNLSIVIVRYNQVWL